MVAYILAQDQLLLDSGSALTWVGANNKSYVKTKTSVKTKESVVSIASRAREPAQTQSRVSEYNL